MTAPSIRIRHQSRYRPTVAGTFHLLLQITAPHVDRGHRQRPPLDLSFVVDRSGSMSGGAFDLARTGVEHALRLLNERDSVSLVVYDDRIDTLLTQRHLDGDAYARAVRRLRRVGPRGSTDLAGGWLTGCDQLAAAADGAQHRREGGQRSVVRALLLTDGLANVGMTDAVEIAGHAAELAARGISTSTFGTGSHYDEELLGQMADAGRGHFHHIPDAAAIPQVFAGELGEMLDLAVRDARLSLRLPSGWDGSLMNDLPVERNAGWISLPLGEMASRESRSLLWELTLPTAVDGQRDELEIRLTWRDATTDQVFEETIVHPVETRRDPGRLDSEVQDELAQFVGARARAEAIRLHRMGEYDRAVEAVELASAMMPQTETGVAMAMELRDDVSQTIGRSAKPQDLKRHYARSRNVQRSRKDYSKP